MDYRAVVGTVAIWFLAAPAALADPTPLRLSRIEGLPFSFPKHLIPHAGRVFFQAHSETTEGGSWAPSVWVTGGTAASTHKLVFPGTNPSRGQHLLGVVGPFVLVNAWSNDGVAPGLYTLDLSSSKVERLRLGHGSQAAMADRRLFVAMENLGGLYSTDGTARGTRLVRAGPVWGPMVSLGRRLVFLAEAHTPAGPMAGVFRADSRGSQPLAKPGNYRPLSKAGDLAYFSLAEAGHDLWATDGTVGGTRAVLAPGPALPLGSCAGRLLFDRGPVHGATTLGATDGTPEGTTSVTDLPGWVYPPFGVADAGKECFFFLGGEPSWAGLWKTDLTAVGTVRVADVYLGLIREPAVGARGRAFFSAFSADYGAELWVSDGTSEGTGPIEHLLPGNLALSPAEFTRAGGRIFFSAMNAHFDRDLWVLDLPPGITIEDASAREATRSRPAVFRVRLSHPSADPVTVHFETEGGTAEPLSDFAPVSGELRFAPGEIVKAVRVHVLADVWAEGTEQFTVRLTNPVNAELDRDHAVGTIRDPAPRLAGSRP